MKKLSDRIDWPVLAAGLGLTFLGLLAIETSAPLRSLSEVGSWRSWIVQYPVKQSIAVALGLGLLLLAARTDYRVWMRAAYGLYGLGILTLAALLIFAQWRHGSRRWFSFGIFSLQPSEFMKVILVIALARFLMYRENISRFRGLLGALALAVVPILLVVEQPDLGTALIMVPTVLAMVYVAGARPGHILGLLGAGAVCAPPIYLFFLREYQRRRIDAFLFPDRSPLGEGYHLLQSKLAVGAGGILGRAHEGLPMPKVPAEHNDFIFAKVAGEWGFVGATLVVCLIGLFVLSCLRILWRVRDPFAQLLVVGVSVQFSVQAFTNIAMTLGLAPITGMTLPFLSYGGSSVLASFWGLGLVLAVATQWVPSFSGKDFAEGVAIVPEIPVDAKLRKA